MQNNNINSNTLLEELHDNAVFQLSLSSKELFHSNFLCWLAEDAACSDIFKKVLILFGYDKTTACRISKGLHDGTYMAKREYKKFDFCICEKVKNVLQKRDDKKDDQEEEYIPGRILLILENKFKSIPYEQQLKEYAQKVEKLNKDGQRIKDKLLKQCHKKKDCDGLNQPEKIETKFVLLSLAQEVCGLELSDCKELQIKNEKTGNNTTWKVISYEKYAEELQQAVKNKEGFTSDLIMNYAKFILAFNQLLYENNPKQLPKKKTISDQEWGILSCRSDMKKIRMDDIWQKLVANIIGIKIREELPKELGKYNIINEKKVSDVIGNGAKVQSDEIIILDIGFSHGTALIDIKLKLNQNMLFGIQIQENCYKRLLEVVEQNFDWKDTINKFQDMFRCEKNKNPKWNNDIFEGNLAPQEDHRPKHKNVPEGFGGYSGTFICQWKKINNNAKVGDVIQAIIADFKEAVRIKKKLLLDSSLVQKVYQN